MCSLILWRQILKTSFITVLPNSAPTFFSFSELRGKPELKDLTEPQLCILLKSAAIVEKKKKLFWVLKVLENLLLPLIKWSEGWQLPQRAQQPFPSSCLCLILLCGSGSCFQVVPYPTSQLDPVWLTWLPQVWRGWEWDNSRGISRFGLTWRPGKAARSLSRSSVRSTLLLARGLGLQFDYVLQQIL